MPKPQGYVLYGESIPVIRENGENDAVEQWSQTNASIGVIDNPTSGWHLASNDLEVEPTNGGLFKVTATGEVLKPEQP